MKLQFPFRDYTSEELQSAHGDERNQMLGANDSRTSENLQFLLIAGLALFAIGSAIYSFL